MHRLTRRLALALPAGGLLAATRRSARAQAPWPAKPVTVIIPFGPSGGADVVGRLVFAQAGAADGPGFVIENRAGAGGNIGVEALSRAAPDGYTLGTIAISTHGVNPTLYRRLPFDPVADFTPIALLSLQPVVVAVRAESPIQDLAGLAQWKQGELTYASAGNGTSGHMAGELLRLRTGLPLLHVPYRGSGPAWTDTLGGRVDLVIDNVQAGLPHHAAKRMRILGVSSAARIEVLPEVPTIASVVPDYVVNSWNGLAGPAGLPPPIRDRMNGLVRQWLGQPALQARFRDLGIGVPADTSPEFLADFIKKEIALWAPVVRQSGMQPD